MNNKIIFLVLCLLLVSHTPAKIINVPGDQQTIQGGINSAVNGDTVLVAPGTYYENIRFYGKRIVLTSRFYEKQDVSYILTTIINGSNPSKPDSASCVLIIDKEDSTTVLQGFTITGGTGTKWNDEHGAGLYCEGGGILTALTSPVIQHNLIINNAANNRSGVKSCGGGGIRSGDGAPKILNNIIKNNDGRYGGGIVLNYCCGAIVKNNIIVGNTGGQDYGGGGVWINKITKNKQSVLENNTIINNSSTTSGGGIYLFSGSSAILRNSIVYGNTAKTLPQISLSGSVLTTSYSDIQGGKSGTGNIDNNPQFTDSSFHLTSGSPCIDAGDTAAVYNDSEDPSRPGSALFPSGGGLRNDMGAYGGKDAAVFPDFLPVKVEQERGLLQKEFRLEQNYPNPFNPSTLISFFLPHDGSVTLKVLDILGREIAVLINTYYKSGYYNINFNASGYPSGIYLYQLSMDKESSITKKMILLR